MSAKPIPYVTAEAHVHREARRQRRREWREAYREARRLELASPPATGSADPEG